MLSIGASLQERIRCKQSVFFCSIKIVFIGLVTHNFSLLALCLSISYIYDNSKISLS